MTTGIVKSGAAQVPRTREEWLGEKKRRSLQISALGGPQAARRAAELAAMLDVASEKMDRFGWANMDATTKQSLRAEWCDVLAAYELQEVKAGIDRVFSDADGKLRAINEYRVKAAIEKIRAEEYAAMPSADDPARQTRAATHEENEASREEAESRRAVNPERAAQAAAILKSKGWWM